MEDSCIKQSRENTKFLRKEILKHFHIPDENFLYDADFIKELSNISSDIFSLFLNNDKKFKKNPNMQQENCVLIMEDGEIDGFFKKGISFTNYFYGGLCKESKEIGRQIWFQIAILFPKAETENMYKKILEIDCSYELLDAEYSSPILQFNLFNKNIWKEMDYFFKDCLNL